ncbi:hypothetical protein PERMA_A0034 (plasmid) [Persephonella marina EX-H1]|uniref:Uncharacterized protein n=1 Tax=Persephonella marina (strain DSM 14350 / EX-H1) TaxID=123214 RepID=C0QUW3_PERMH|nr:hypothetical protein [Persephonella marina]ACO05004.1 hypothetical protein PERMA_A0034 [Persephonella marina EX-H1]
MALKRLEIIDKAGNITAFIELKLEKEIIGNETLPKLTVNVNGKKATTTAVERFLALLEGAFFGLIGENNEVIETPEGYIVFFRGKDRYGIRVGNKSEREVVFLRKLAYRELYHWINMQLIASF